MPVPLLMLMYEYGFVTSFIELDDSLVVPEPVSLVLKFTEDVLGNKRLVRSDYWSLNERLLIHSTAWNQDDYIYYRLPIPKNIREDVIRIIDSKYTLVSDSYKKMVTTTAKNLPKWPENMGHFLLKNNTPLAVLKRHSTLRTMSEQEMGVRIDKSIDLVRKFNLELDVYCP